MSEFKVGYSLRVYAPRSIDPTESTILTPAAGAPHSDEFKASSIERSGYKPYLHGDIQGRRGRIDLLNRKLDVGALTVRLIDKKLATDNLTRWWTAFFGNISGKPQGRLRVEIDETLDGGATWTLFFTGELVGSSLDEKVGARLSVRERSETLQMKVFVGTPHSSISYAAIPTLLPVGFRGALYGDQPGVRAYSGLADYMKVNSSNWNPTGGGICVFLDQASIADENNLLTINLWTAVAPHGTVEVLDPFSASGKPKIAWTPNYTGRIRCRLTHGGNSGDYRVGGLLTKWEERPGRPMHQRVTGFFIKELETTEAGYLALPAAATALSNIYLYVEEEVSEARPLLIDDVDPVTFLEDLCAGKFGSIYRFPQKLPAGASYGDVARSVATNTASFNAVRSVWPTARFMLAKSESLLDWAEKNILIPYHLALFLNKSGEVCLVDLRMPNSVSGIATLTDDDVVQENDVEWQHDPTQAILRVDITRYTERLRSGNDLWALPDPVPKLSNGGGIFEETAFPMESIFIGSIDYGDNTFKIDAKGYRSMESEQYQSRPRSVYLDQTLVELASELQRPFGFGLTTIPLPCRRTATVTALNPGSLVIVDVDVVPDPATWVRGGPQLCRVLEVSEDGPNVNLRLVYLSSTSAVAAPTLAAPAQETNNTYTGVTCAVTLNGAGNPVMIRYAVTDTATGSPPADSSPLWRIAQVNGAIGWVRSNQTVRIRDVPPNRRIWVQGRSFPIDDPLRLPSAWTAAAAPGYVDTAALPAPSSLAASASDTTCVLSWTNGAPDICTEILLATPTGDPRRAIVITDPGTTSWTLRGLEVSTQYRAEVRHVFGQHRSAGDTEDFTTTATSTTAPTPTHLSVVAAT